MLLSQMKENKIIKEVLVTKETTDRFWDKTLRLYIEGKVEEDMLVSAMEISNKVDKEIIEKYGMEIFLSAYRKEQGAAY